MWSIYANQCLFHTSIDIKMLENLVNIFMLTPLVNVVVVTTEMCMVYSLTMVDHGWWGCMRLLKVDEVDYHQAYCWKYTWRRQNMNDKHWVAYINDMIYIYSRLDWPVGSIFQGLFESSGCSHSTPTHRGLGVQHSPLNPKGHLWVQEESCNRKCAKVDGSTMLNVLFGMLV